MKHSTHKSRSRAGSRLRGLSFAWFALLLLPLTALAQDGGDAASPGVERLPYYVKFGAGRSNQVDRAVRDLGGEVTHRFDRLDTVAVMLPARAIDALAGRSDVKFIEPVPEHRIQAQVVPWNIDQYQARDIWDRNRDNVIDAGAPDGSGMRFCIIDTGFLAAHDDFQGITVSGVSQINGESWTEDGDGHGTHVAGTANAVMNNIGVVGAMPGGAELIILKVFSNAGGWVTGQSNLGAAAQTCRDLGANVLSMSLGGGYSATEEAIFQDLYDNFGILNIAAAGNDGNTAQSYPAGYPSVISVAAIDEGEVAADFSQYPPTAFDPNNPPANVEWDVVELAGGGVNVLSTYPAPNGEVPAYQAIGTQTWDGGHIDEAGFGDETGILVDGGLCLAGSGDASWNGRIVICERGSVAFSEKVNEVKDNGGLAAIIYNNVAGGFAGTCGGGCTTPLIPAISLSQAAGQALIADDLGSSVNVIANDGSGCVGCTGGYAFLSGTSMATPGVAAAVALAWDACGGPSTVTNKQIRQLLRDSARDLTGTKPGSGFVYGAGYDQVTGWGLVQLADARELGNQRFGGACPIGLQVTPPQVEVCAADGSTDFTVTLDDQFLGSATLSASGNPAGTLGGFTQNPVVHPDKDTVYTLSGLGSAAGGSYTISFTATDDSDPGNTADGQAVLDLFSAAPTVGTLTGPADGSTGVVLRPTLSWTAANEASTYELQISTSPTFDTIAYSATVEGTSHAVGADLNQSTLYHWRVRATNVCGNGGWYSAFSFTTTALVCTTIASTDVPKNLTDASGGGNPRSTTSVLTTTITDPIDSINVIGLEGTHTWINDLHFDLSSPGGTTVRIMDRSCAGQDNFLLSLSDSASPGAWPCPPTDGGTYQPSNPLAAFAGEVPSGTWTLTITDNVRQDSGTLEAWALEFCVIPAVTVDPTTTTINSISPAASQAVGQAYTVDVSVAGTTPTGTITVSDGTDSCLITLPAGSCDLTSTTTGAKTITADYSGDADDAPSSDSVAYAITAAASTTTITSVNPPVSSPYNTSYTVNVSVSGYSPTGTILVEDGQGATCNIVLPATSCAIASTFIGPITLLATYPGDANNGASSDTELYEITPIPATITLADLTTVYSGGPQGATITTNPPGLAFSATYDGGGEPTAAGSYALDVLITEPGYTGSASDTFTITPASATVTISNTSQVYDGSPKPVTVTTNPAAIAYTVTYAGSPTAPSAVGSYAVVATVTDPNYTGSANATLEITAAASTTTIDSIAPAGSQTAGQPYTVSASVTGASPSGSILISDGTDSCVIAAPSGSCDLVTATPGTVTITADYTGDAGNAPSSDSTSYDITASPTTTSIVAIAPAGSQTVGQAYTVSVSVSGGSPTGTITVSDGSDSCVIAAPSGSCDLTSTTTGNKTITADYSGDADDAPSSDSTAYIVSTAVSSTAITSINPAGSSAYNTAYTVSVAVGGYNSTGTVVVDDGNGVTCNIVLPAASCQLVSTVVGATTVSASYPGDANNDPSSDAAPYEITAISATITLADLSRVFNGGAQGATITTTPPGLAFTATYNGGPEPTNVGSYALEVTITEPGYSGSASDTFTITPATATVTIGNTSQVFDGNPKPVSVTTTPPGLVTTVTYDGSPTAPSAVGTYAVEATVDDPNWTGTASATLEITASSATITLADLSRVFTGLAQGATITTSPPGLAFTATYNGGPEPTNVGSYALEVTITEPGYSGSASDTFTITPATATVTIGNTSQVFDGSPKPVSVTTTPPGLVTTVTYDGSPTAPSAVGTYAVEATVDDPNWTGTASATLEITASSATITLADLSRVFTGLAQGATITTSPPGLAFTATYNGGPEPTNVGSYALEVTITEPGYSGSASDTFTITPATATVTIGNTSQVFDGNPKPVSVTTTPPGLVTTVTYDGSPTPPSAVGTYAVEATVDDPNWTGTASATLEITAATATITLADLSRVFNGGAQGATITTSPPGLAFTATYSGGPEPTNVGSYALEVTITEPGYSGSASDTFTITPATATVTIGNTSQVFDGNPKPVSVTTTPPGLVTTVTYDGSPTPPSAVGTYAVEATVDDPNWTGTATAALEITAATATISITDTSQVYDGNPKPVTVTTTPPDLSTTVTYDGGATVPTDVGSYAVEVTVDDPNYTGTASDTLEITAATATIS
ncbi:MBG domain-containing protein, partial [Wenzhouxiangella marina]